MRHQVIVNGDYRRFEVVAGTALKRFSAFAFLIGTYNPIVDPLGAAIDDPDNDGLVEPPT